MNNTKVDTKQLDKIFKEHELYLKGDKNNGVLVTNRLSYLIVENYVFKNLDLDTCIDFSVFNQCIIDGTYLGTYLVGCEFSNCIIINSSLIKADVIECSFINSIVINTDFSRAEMRRLTIHNSKFDNCLWYNTDLYNSIIKDSWIKGYSEDGNNQYPLLV